VVAIKAPELSVTSSWRSDVHEGLTEPFDRLFRAEYARVTAIAFRILRDRSEAEDVAQDVFLAYHRRHPAEAPYAAAWLHAAAAHTALNTLRGRRRREQREAADARMQPKAPPDPLRVLEERERDEAVRAALARLPERSAAVLALRYSGLSYGEVAAAMGIRINQIGTLLKRAEAAFRKEVSIP
jgi:RNA polymerase sigma-70 factor (ECF subfamily)